MVSLVELREQDREGDRPDAVIDFLATKPPSSAFDPAAVLGRIRGYLEPGMLISVYPAFIMLEVNKQRPSADCHACAASQVALLGREITR